MRSQSSFFKAAGLRSRSRRRPNEFHTCSICYISEMADEGRSCMHWTEQKFRPLFATCECTLSCWKIAPGMLSRKRTTSGCRHFTGIPVAFKIILKLWQIGSSMIRNLIPDCKSGCSATMSFDNELWKSVLTSITSNTNAAIMVPQIQAWFIWKDNLVSISLPGSALMSPLKTMPSMVCREGNAA